MRDGSGHGLVAGKGSVRLSVCLSSACLCVSDSYLISFSLSLPACVRLSLWSQSLLFLSVRYKQDRDFLEEMRNSMN